MKSLQTAAGVRRETGAVVVVVSLPVGKLEDFVPDVGKQSLHPRPPAPPLAAGAQFVCPLNLECKPPASERGSLQITQYRKAQRDSWFEITRLSHADNVPQAVLTLPDLGLFFFLIEWLWTPHPSPPPRATYLSSAYPSGCRDSVSPPLLSIKTLPPQPLRMKCLLNRIS